MSSTSQEDDDSDCSSSQPEGLSSTKEAYDVSNGKKPFEQAVIGLGDQEWRQYYFKKRRKKSLGCTRSFRRQLLIGDRATGEEILAIKAHNTKDEIAPLSIKDGARQFWATFCPPNAVMRFGNDLGIMYQRTLRFGGSAYTWRAILFRGPSDQDGKQLPGSSSNVEQFSLVHHGSDLLVADYRASPCFGKTCTSGVPSRRVVTIHELETGLPSEVIIATALIMEYFEERRIGQREHLPSALAS